VAGDKQIRVIAMRHKRKGIASAVSMALGFALALSPSAGQALGLGGIKVHSALNEPLNAEIDITSASEKELKALVITLPSRAEFEAAGVERLAYQSLIQFVVAKRADGRPYLHLRTDSPIDEPFLHLLLQAEWQGGKLVREYTALIDPPYQVPGKPAAVEPPATVEPAAVEPAPVPGVPVPEAAPTPVAEAPAVAPPPTEEQIKAEMEAEATGTRTAAAPAPVAAPSPAEPTGTGFVSEPAAPVQAAPAAEAPPESARVEALPEPAPTAAPAAMPREAPVAARTVPAWSGVGEYHVREGDTLWEISTKVRSDTPVSVEQVVLALYRTNRDAFFGNNVNNLKAGKILRVPEREEVESVSSSLARKEFRAQYDVWQEYKLKLASSGATVKVATGEPETAVPVAKGEVAPVVKPDARKAAPTTVPAETPAPAAKGAPTEELLKIVRSDAESKKAAPGKQAAEAEAGKDTSGTERQALADRVTTLEEALLSKQVEQKELGEKIGQVRALLKKESRLIEIERKDVATAPKPAAKEIPVEPVKSEPPKAVIPEPPKAAMPEPVKPVETAPAPAAPAPVAPPPEARKKVARAVAPPPPAERGFFEGLMDDLGEVLLPVIVGVVVLLGGGIALVYMRRRQKSIAEFEESILSSEAISSETPTTSETTSGVQAAPAGDTSFLSDFSQGGMGNLHTDEVDPIAEAEVYLAYGRDETAEEILKEAMIKNPQREEIKVKLLEIYHQRNDVKAFETLAEEYYAQLGGRPSKLWAKAEEMGRKLNPDNPMFRGGGAPGRAAAATIAPVAAPAFADTLGSAAAPMAPAAPAAGGIEFDLGTAAPEEPADTGLEFDLQAGSGGDLSFVDTMKSATPAPAGDMGLEGLDFGKPADNVIDFAPEKPAAVEAGADLSLDWDMGAAGTAAGKEEAVSVAEAPAAAEAVPSQWDETATKLDLAKAYIDMGDAEGARSILGEVIAEGNDAQKKQAQELAAQLA
jgi:pilus assembly protein FimV